MRLKSSRHDIMVCTTDHCALSHCKSREKPHPRSVTVMFLSTSLNGFRAHGDLAPSVDDGSLHRKCFSVRVYFFALFEEAERRTSADAVLFASPAGLFRRAPRCPATPGKRRLSHFVGFEVEVAPTPVPLHNSISTPPRVLPAHPHLPPPILETAHRSPSMESESDHEHRDDESVSEQEELVEETKPKPALKKAREPAAPVERPELPYVSSHKVQLLRQQC
jgi:hypothetical protein